MTTQSMTTQSPPCAASSITAMEPLAGTAPYARAWIVMEEPGSWGREALRDSGLDPELVEHLTHALTAYGVRSVLARHPSRRRLEIDAARNVWVATCTQSAAQGRHGHVADVREILQWDLEALGLGELPGFGSDIEHPWQFVCTHSKRDNCCATLGRRYVGERSRDLGLAPTDLDSEVWECSHLGGHRFAPTSLFLPSGRLYGRLDRYPPFPQMSEPPADALRGASYLDPVEQVADQAIRRLLELPYATTTHVRATDQGGDERERRMIVDVQGTDRWLVDCSAGTVASPASCGADSTGRTVWRVNKIEKYEQPHGV